MKTLPTLSVLYYLIELNVFFLPIFIDMPTRQFLLLVSSPALRQKVVIFNHKSLIYVATVKMDKYTNM